ncbi:MAG: putative DNA binding domain-containing protein [Ignavibacteria bacterium]|nr:putative DNA binding domain-containing protein [Ignavibacteria bacterium]
MNELELQRYILDNYPKENASVEWKTYSNLKNNVSGHEGDDIISYVSAIANMNGGVLIIGIEDITANILGVNNFHDYTIENLPLRLTGNCTNVNSEGLLVEAHTTLDTQKIIWILHIPKHKPRKPVIAHKKTWQRIGDSLVQMTKEREELILNEPLQIPLDWTGGIIESASLSDLDDGAIIKARILFKEKNKHIAELVDKWDDITFLNKARITIEGKITRTSILLLGKYESNHFLAPGSSTIMWVLQNNKGEKIDYQSFCCPLLLDVDKVFAKIRNLKYRYIKSATLFPEEIDMYDSYVIREPLHNCIAHQDYELGGRINVIEKENQIEFENLGVFLPGSINPLIFENYTPTFYRNRFLADAMLNLKMIDTIGSGIKRIFEIQRDRFFPLPDFDFGNKKIKVTVTGKVIDLEYAKLLANKNDLSLYEIYLLDKVQKNKSITSEEVKVLKQKKYIDGKKGHYFISASIAEVTGEKIAYTKNKGFSTKIYSDILLESLQHHKKGLSRKEVEEILLHQFPESLNMIEKKVKLTGILTKLRKDAKIYNSGSDSKPLWALKD